MVNLRKLEPTDVVFLYQWENDAAAWADGSNHNPLSQKDLRDYISASTGDIYKDGQLRLIIHQNDQMVNDQMVNDQMVNDQMVNDQMVNGATLGCVDLFEFDPRNRRAEIGMYIAPEYRGKGVGTEALRLLEEYAFGFLNMRLIYAFISTANTECSALFRQAGFTPSSVLPSWTLEGDAVLWFKQASQ